jgi:tRNA G18 (ribose-2'-O)-methylase SpoU
MSYYGIGILNTKCEQNIGTLFRSAMVFGASYIFTIGKRYEKQHSDTMKSYRHLPLYNYLSLEDFKKSIPYSCRVVGIEIIPGARPLKGYVHPKQACYLLGAEDHGLTKEALAMCHDIIYLPGNYCLNVSVAGSIVMYDRCVKELEADIQDIKWRRNIGT